MAAVAHLEYVFSGDDTAVLHVQVSDLAVGVWAGGVYLCRFSSGLRLAQSVLGEPWGWNPASLVANMASGMLLLLSSENGFRARKALFQLQGLGLILEIVSLGGLMCSLRVTFISSLDLGQAFGSPWHGTGDMVGTQERRSQCYWQTRRAVK